LVIGVNLRKLVTVLRNFSVIADIDFMGHYLTHTHARKLRNAQKKCNRGHERKPSILKPRRRLEEIVKYVGNSRRTTMLG
jgi:hypothetical protein